MRTHCLIFSKNSLTILFSVFHVKLFYWVNKYPEVIKEPNFKRKYLKGTNFRGITDFSGINFRDYREIKIREIAKSLKFVPGIFYKNKISSLFLISFFLIQIF